MPVPKSLITDAELNILKVLWIKEPKTAREITTELHEQVNASTIGTVQKLASRLEEKQMLSRDKSQHPHLFRSLVSRDDVAGMQLKECAGKLSGGSLLPFVRHLTKSSQLSDADKMEIQRMLDSTSENE